ncbi:MAG: ribosome small subunit-dependent GTPase A [Treponema sp.]|jgi:ribosome biogenesis GTPase|nr:ribosome small subunit-dependent GTPase A [Treponema sp.]
MRGLVIRGSRNIFTVRIDREPGPGLSAGTELECRIKGKVLKGVEEYYNPLAPGDRVLVEADPLHPGTGQILALEERKNLLARFNQKGLGPRRSAASQLLAANVDLLICVTSPLSPPFRPRFIDRAMLQGEIARIPPVVVCNKYDLSGEDPDVEERLEDFIRIGYRVLRVSARTGEGLDLLRDLIRGRLSVFLGQSGVGKSSPINALFPGTQVKVGRINEKYDRGTHTTTMAALFSLPDARGSPGETGVIDTPGIRRFIPQGVSEQDLILYMPEFAPLAGKCTYGLSCSHRTEPGCKIMEAVAAGVIHEDRYESFLRIQDELKARDL